MTRQLEILLFFICLMGSAALVCAQEFGPRRGPVSFVDDGSASAFAKYPGNLHHAIILASPPADVPPPSTPPQAGTPTPLPAESAEPNPSGRRSGGAPFSPFRRQLLQLLKEE